MRVKVRPSSALAVALRDLPGVTVKHFDGPEGLTRILVDAGGQLYDLRVVWVGHGWPSEVKEALKHVGAAPSHEVVFTAKRFSPGAIRILEEHDANWADEGGQARIIMPPGLVVLRETPRKADEEPPQLVRWPPSALQIAELALHEKTHELHTGVLANRTGWSAAQVSKVLKMFDELGWTDRLGGKSGRASRRVLISSGAMLDSWADHIENQRRRKKLGHRASRDLLRFAHMELWDRLGRDRNDWALTTWAGLEMTTPFATTVPTLHVYLSANRFNAEVEEVMRATGIREVDEGARIEFWEADFPILTQVGQPSGMPVTSRPRLYADLRALGGRGQDAAAHYRDTALGI